MNVMHMQLPSDGMWLFCHRFCNSTMPWTESLASDMGAEQNAANQSEIDTIPIKETSQKEFANCQADIHFRCVLHLLIARAWIENVVATHCLHSRKVYHGHAQTVLIDYNTHITIRLTAHALTRGYPSDHGLLAVRVQSRLSLDAKNAPVNESKCAHHGKESR